jgi:hypothetical protein
MSQVLVALLLVLPLLRGPSIDPSGGKAARRTIAPSNGSCVDPDGRPCVRATSSLNTDKGLGVDPNG